MSIVIAFVLIFGILKVRTSTGKAIRIQDGDSFIYANKRCRIIGYDAPEYDQIHGLHSRQALRRMLDSRFIIIHSGRDVYGRYLVRIITRKGPLASRMILSGCGHPETLLGSLISLWPRLARRGIWSERRPIHPSLWRARRW